MVIDFHCHYSQWGGQRSPDDTPERTVSRLNQIGVDGALIVPMRGLFSNCSDHHNENHEIYEYCSEYPDYLFPGFTVNPFSGDTALEEIRRCKGEYDIKVLKLHSWLQGFSICCSEMDAIAELCQELDIAILFHDGTPVYSHPLQLARLCREFPDLRVIAGHCGLGDLWREAMLAAQRYPNYFLCFCGPRERAMRVIIENVSPQQLCVGSDLSTSDKDDAVLWFRWRSFRSLELSDDIRHTIESETPMRILKGN